MPVLRLILTGFAALAFCSLCPTGYGQTASEADQENPFAAPETEPDDEYDPFSVEENPFGDEEDDSFNPFADTSSDPFGSDLDEPLPMLPTKGARLRGLDKITGRAVDIDVGVSDGVLIGGLWVVLQACYASPPEEIPESAAFLQVEDHGFAADPQRLSNAEADLERRIFSGWMFASSPGLSALEHSLYDVWVIRCITEAPDGAPVASNPEG